MPGLKLYQSNHLEKLVDALCSVLDTPLSSPLKTEIIVVQSKGMERWLSMELAKKFGIWTNCKFPFLDNFVWEIFKSIMGEIPDMEVFSPYVMAWQVMDKLIELKEYPEFSQIKQYIDEEESELKTFQLSEQIANVFDRYSVYRPEMIFLWHNRYNHKDWQQILWYNVVKGNEEKNRVFILYSFLKEILKGSNNGKEKSPIERLSIFGISAIPPYHLNVIKAVSSVLDIHLFFLNPTNKYWGDIVPEKVIRKKGGKDLYYETGNPLLASMGKMGRDFFDEIIELTKEEHDLFDEPEANNLLTTIQYDMYYLIQRGKDVEKALISEEDISIQVHSCHSPLREIEVLYNNLLFLFEKYGDLKPKDILVMTPDIEAYAPFVSAVFEAHRGEREWIPYSITDRKTSRENPVVSLFLKILALFQSRFYASDVMDVLDDTLIKEKFKLDEVDIDLILRWINDLNIRWGIDEFHRMNQDSPAFKENSWRAGIERLLLGYAMFNRDQELYNSILPYNEMEGDFVETLEKLLNFLFPLFDYAKKILTPRTIDAWADLLIDILDTFIVTNDETERYVHFIRDTLINLKEIRLSYGFLRPVSFQVILYYLKKRLSIREYTAGFITGGVTFCEMLPMRSIPFKVIALIGMNHDTYPRESRPLSFDLIVKNPKKGDRSLRDEDRYIFLEALLSARLCLYISYIGQSVKDNTVIPPSVVVSELLDYIEKGFYHPEKDIFDIIVKKHPIQSFSPRYFQKDTNIFNYFKEDYDTVKAKFEKTYRPSHSIVRMPKDDQDQIRNITNVELKKFFRHPVRYFFNNRLGIFLDETRLIEDDEPMELNYFEGFKIKQRFVEDMITSKDIDKTKKVITAEGMLPPGSLGKVILDDVAVKAEGFFDIVKEYLVDKREPIDFNVELNNFRIDVRLDEIYAKGIVKYRASKVISAKYLIELWIDHLFFNIYKDNKNSVFLSMEKKYFFKPVDHAKELMIRLLRVYEEGLRSPIKLFPDTSYNYILKLKTKEYTDALNSAREIWERENLYKRPEKDDPYYFICFKDQDPLDQEFIYLSKEVFGPLVEAISNNEKYESL